MKLLPFLAAFFVLNVSADKCGSKQSEPVRYKGKLETKALCMNYTLRVIGDIDTSLVESKWTDESTGKSYEKAFGLANPCNFPANIEQGEEFFFYIDTAKQKDCAVCMAYYPTPSKKLSIKVVEK